MDGKQAPPAGGGSGSAEIPPLRAEVEGLSVLCAEDNNVLQRMLAKWFENMQMPLTQVFDGQRAVEACEKTQFGIIFTDVAMPALDGVEAARLIRSRPTSLNQKTPIVCFSGLNTDAISNSGVNDFLRKPFTQVHLVNCINRWAGREVGPEDNFVAAAPQQQNEEPKATSPNTNTNTNTEGAEEENSVPATEMKNQSAAAPMHRQADVPEPPPREQNESCTVLFVASDPPTQRVVANFLAGRELTVQQAYSLKGALNVAQSHRVDVVLVDTADAIAAEFVYKIRKGTSANRLVPMIALSSHGRPVVFIGQGYNDMLSKPFNKLELNSVVDKWIPFLPSLFESARQNQQEPSNVFCTLGYTVDPPRPDSKFGVSEKLHTEPQSDSNPPSGPERGLSRKSAAKARQSLEHTGDDSTDGQAKRKRRRGGNEGTDKRLRVEQSRMSHNEKERSRRQDITDTVHDFRLMVPGCTDKTDKATVLRKGVDYLQGLIDLAKQQNLI